MLVSLFIIPLRRPLCETPDRKTIVDVRNFALSLPRGVTHESTAYPAQYGKTPGVITASTEKFYFTPLLGGHKLEIPTEDVIGIKKAIPKGISLRVKDASQDGGERREKFVLVYERDELFGRLVGMGGKKWTRI